jgi:hypothetical protein
MDGSSKSKASTDCSLAYRNDILLSQAILQTVHHVIQQKLKLIRQSLSFLLAKSFLVKYLLSAVDSFDQPTNLLVFLKIISVD